MSSRRSVEVKKTKKRRSRVADHHENQCFRCGVGGELVLCDKSTCPKSYHLSCLRMSKPPSGINRICG